MDRDQAEVERLVGGPVVSVEHAEWGFTNHTDVVTLADGGRVVLQRYASRSMAAHRLQITAALAEPLGVAGVPIPRVLRSDLDASPPYALLEELPGVPGQVAAGPDLLDPVFPGIAVQMGELARRLASVPTEGLRLPRLWADPNRLVVRATSWATQLAPSLSPSDKGRLAHHLAAAPALLSGRPAVLAHGDFGLTNILVADGRISALLDLEFARLADPLFDVAWWAWLMRFHTPEAYARTWTGFATAAGIDPTDARTAQRIRTLQVLRVLEATLYFAYRGDDARLGWTRRLVATLSWDDPDG